MTGDPDMLHQLRELAQRAYAPYSGFRVAAILVDADGRTAAGVNVENASYGLTSCAERNAVFRFVTDGLRKPARLHLFADTEARVTPCGACRQVLLEFDPDMTVVVYNQSGETGRYTVGELIPHPFCAEDLERKP